MKLTDKEIEPYLQAAIKDLQTLISIPSIETHATENAPFGLGKDLALQFVINLCEKQGLKSTIGYNREYGYADYGAGKKLFGIMCHLDVVKPGDLSKWKYGPYEPVIDHGEIYGRGSLDDKGPTIITIYALKYLMDHGYCPSDHQIRLFFGLTEETTWESIHSYLKHERTPDVGYTPDGSWPLVYAEKAVLNFDIIGPGVKDCFISGGDAYNIVCDLACVKQCCNIEELKAYFEKQKWAYRIQGNDFMALGKSGHGSVPKNGINAAIHLLHAWHDLNIKPELTIAKFVKDNLDNESYTLSKIFNNFSDESGEVSSNLGMIKVDESEQRLRFDCRMPMNYEQKDIIKDIETYLKNYPKLRMEFVDWERAAYMSLDNPMVKEMLRIYQEVTNDFTNPPIVQGGATYAKAFPNCIAFGATRPEGINLMHGANERISIMELKEMLLIYIKAIQTIIT